MLCGCVLKDLCEWKAGGTCAANKDSIRPPQITGGRCASAGELPDPEECVCVEPCQVTAALDECAN